MTVNWVKLEQNDHATTLIPRSYGEELALCKRYYRVGIANAVGVGKGSTAITLTSMFDVEMRVNPAVLYKSTINIFVVGVGIYSTTGIASTFTTTTKGVFFDTQPINNTVGNGVTVLATGSNASIGYAFDAEI